jgi:hypothetical protein
MWMSIRPLSMSATLRPFAGSPSETRRPGAWAVVSAARAFRPGTASRNRTTSSALGATGRRRGSRAWAIRSGTSVIPSGTPWKKRSAATVRSRLARATPFDARCTRKVRTSSSVTSSGARPENRLNFDTAWRQDRCVAGERMRTVMSEVVPEI